MTATIELRASGKMFGELIEGRFLDICRHGERIRFDLHESARQGRPVIVRINTGEDESESHESVPG